jgi:hypothetical protein
MEPDLLTVTNSTIEIDWDKADDQTLLWLTDLESDQALSEMLSSFQLSENKMYLIRDEIQLVGVGQTSIDQFMERISNLLYEIAEKDKAAVIQALVLYVISQMSNDVLSLPENSEYYSIKKQEDTSPQPPKTTEILSALVTHPEKENMGDKDQLISEIENPTPTVAKQDFILPNTKPNTSDVLKKVADQSATPGVIPATIPTAFPPELDLSIDTAGIIDPFKSETPTTTPSISTQMEAKLGSMTGSSTKESFKIMPLSETMKNLNSTQSDTKKSDPYREPIV